MSAHFLVSKAVYTSGAGVAPLGGSHMVIKKQEEVADRLKFTYELNNV